MVTARGAQYATVTTAGSYLSSSDKRVHFGLGPEATVQKVEIRWPSGVLQTIQGVKADQISRWRSPDENKAAHRRFRAECCVESWGIADLGGQVCATRLRFESNSISRRQGLPHSNDIEYSRCGSNRTDQVPPDSCTGIVRPADSIFEICWPCGGRTLYSPVTSGRNAAEVARPPFQDTSTSTSPRARSPRKWPSGQAEGNAGSNAITPEWLCNSISAMAAVPPKLASI